MQFILMTHIARTDGKTHTDAKSEGQSINLTVNDKIAVANTELI